MFVGNLPFDVTEEELRDLVEGNAEEPVKAPKGDGEESEESDSDSDSEDEEEAEGDEDNATPQASSSRSGAKSGLIKTRVAQFEDTGRCKG